MDAVTIARSLVELGESWAKGKGVNREIGIAAMVDIIADGEVEMYEEDGRVWCRLCGDPRKPKRG